MKTVLEIASENGVSKQAVYQRISKLKDKELKQCLKKGEKGETLVNKRGQNILRASFSKALHSSVDQHVDHLIDYEVVKSIGGEHKEEFTIYREVIESLKKQVESLEKDKDRLETKLDKKEELLSEKDQQIKDCFMMLAQMNGDMKKLQAANESITEEKEIIEHRPVQEERKSLFARIIQAFKGE